MDNPGFQTDSDVNGECHKSDGVALSSIVLNGDNQANLKPQTSADRSKLSSGSFNLPKTGALKKYTRFADGVTINQKQRQYRRNPGQGIDYQKDLPAVYCIHKPKFPSDLSATSATMFPMSCMSRCHTTCSGMNLGGPRECCPREDLVWPVVPTAPPTIPDHIIQTRSDVVRQELEDDALKMQNDSQHSYGSMKTEEDYTKSFSEQQFETFVNEYPKNVDDALPSVAIAVPVCYSTNQLPAPHFESYDNRRNHRRSSKMISAYPPDFGERNATLTKRGLMGGWKLTFTPSKHSHRCWLAIVLCVLIVAFVLGTSIAAVKWVHREEAETLARANASSEEVKMAFDGKTVTGVFSVTNQPVSPALADNSSEEFQLLATEISDQLDALFFSSTTVSDILNHTTVTRLGPGNETADMSVHCRISLTSEPVLGDAANLVGIEFLRGLVHRDGMMWLGNFTVDVQSIAFYALTSVPSPEVTFTPRWSPWSSWSSCPSPAHSGDTSTRSRLCRLHNGTGEVLSSIDPCLMAEDGGDLEVADCLREATKREVISSTHWDDGNGGTIRSYNSVTEEAKKEAMETTRDAMVDDDPGMQQNNESMTTKLSISNPRHCDECLAEEVCIALTKEDVPICRQIRDIHDPTGCGGHCRLGVEFCKKLDVDAYRCLDDNNCFEEEFQCGNRLCIPAVKRCDGHKNCYDETDEMGCECDLATHFQCLNNTSCLPNEKKCDQVINCWDGSDEANCTVACPLAEQFTCNDGECIPRSYFCDSLADCTDLSDEPFGCGVKCVSNEWKCKNGRCVPKHSLCDGKEDCGDKSDEENC